MHSQTERKVTPKGKSVNREEVRDVVIVSFDEATGGQRARSRISCPLWPFVCRDSDGQRPRAFQLQTSCISKTPFRQLLHLSVSQSVSPSLSRYNDSLRRSEIFMPIGYHFRRSHTLIYELSPFCLGRGLIGLSDLSFPL